MAARIWLEQTTSTNDEVRRLAQEGAPHGTAVMAGQQTAGRGRLGRSWVSPPHSAALLSVLIRAPIRADRVALLCLAAAVAVAEVAGPIYRIKWPNDVLAPDGRKVGGILAEAEWQSGAGEDGQLAWATIGVGVNLTDGPALSHATHLLEVDGDRREPRAFAERVVDRLLTETEAVVHEPAKMLARWRHRSVTLGRSVRIGDVQGVARDVDPDGALRVAVDERTEQRVLAGDVEMISESSARRDPLE